MSRLERNKSVAAKNRLFKTPFRLVFPLYITVYLALRHIQSVGFFWEGTKHLAYVLMFRHNWQMEIALWSSKCLKAIDLFPGNWNGKNIVVIFTKFRSLDLTFWKVYFETQNTSSEIKSSNLTPRKIIAVNGCFGLFHGGGGGGGGAVIGQCRECVTFTLANIHVNQVAIRYLSLRDSWNTVCRIQYVSLDR